MKITGNIGAKFNQLKIYISCCFDDVGVNVCVNKNIYSKKKHYYLWGAPHF